MHLKNYFEGTKGIEKGWCPGNTIKNKSYHLENSTIDGRTKTSKLLIDIK